MFLKRFFDEVLAHASYLVGCQATGEAIVIDAARYTAPYHDVAKAEGLHIKAVTETHIHADYLSGTRQLAHETGAKMYLSGEGGSDWQYQFLTDKDQLVFDGDTIQIGNLTLKVMHTPGHTPEHIALILTDHPASQEPMGVFTGDFIFVGDVGRPDLLERAAGLKDTMRDGAGTLYASLQRFTDLPQYLQLWPAHGAGSACGKALGSVPSTVLGFEKLSNWAFKSPDEESFVAEILDGQPEPPKYFALMKKLNRTGPPLVDEGEPAWGDSEALTALHSQGELIVDLRGVQAYASGHLPGSLFLPPGKPLVTWAGWLLPYGSPVALILDGPEQAKQALRSLRSIGLDNVSNLFTSEVLEHQSLVVSQRVKPAEVDWSREYILDVRNSAEYGEGHRSDAHHIHLGYLSDRIDEIPDSPVVHCRSGLRSLIAASILERAGKKPRDVLGGYMAMKKEDLVER